MDAERWAVALLRVFLVVLFGILVVFQVMSLPGQFAYMARESPDLGAWICSSLRQATTLRTDMEAVI